MARKFTISCRRWQQIQFLFAQQNNINLLLKKKNLLNLIISKPAAAIALFHTMHTQTYIQA